MAFWCTGLAQAQFPSAQPTQPTPPGKTTLPPNSVSAVPSLPVQENLFSFDPRQVELRWEGNHWLLVAGGVLLKDFGQRQGDGRQALRLVRELGLTQLGTVGTPQPVMEYWLVGEQAPRGPVPGLRPNPLDLATLRLEQVQGQWCVRDNQRILFSFGTHAEEAEQALAIIRHHRFTHVAVIGRFPSAMILFVSNPDDTTPSPVAAPVSFSPRTTAPGSPPAHPANVRDPANRMPASSAPNSVVPNSLPSGRQFGNAEVRPDLDGRTDQVPFDSRQVQVRRDGKDWKLICGSYTLANFGPNERDARQALAAVQYYRFNQHCLVGRPTPAFSYFLVSGRAPQGLMFGLHSIPFRPDAVTVRQANGRWVIADSSQVLIDFGDRGEEAQQMLRVIQRNRFDHLCRIGPSAPLPLTFLVRAR
jgi:hypothetical protein